MQKVAKQILCCPRQDLWALDRHQAFLHLCQVREVARRVVLGRGLTEVRRKGATVSTRRTGHASPKLQRPSPPQGPRASRWSKSSCPSFFRPQCATSSKHALSASEWAST